MPSPSPSLARRWKLIASAAVLPLLATGIAAPPSPALARPTPQPTVQKPQKAASVSSGRPSPARPSSA